MKISVVMTKDPRNHKSFKIYIPKHAIKSEQTVLNKMEKITGVPWKQKIREKEETFSDIIIESGDLTRFFRKKFPLEEKAYVNWRMKWKNQTIELATGK